MFTFPSRRVIFALLSCLLLSSPVVASGQSAPAGQQISISDSRTGSGPCGFEVQRDLEGTITVESSLDADGYLVLTITGVDVTGTVTNAQNGQSVAIVLVRHNGDVGFSENGQSVEVTLGLWSWFHRGYDTGDATLALNLPADGAEVLDVTPGERYEDPWSQVCSLLS